MPTYYLLIIVIMGVSWYIGFMLKRRFKEYSEMPIGLTGRQVAEKMLHESGIHDVQVVSVPGALTDHYDPLSKTVNLSDWVYDQANVAAAAVAAHECGHAVQHATAYNWLMLRSKLVPAVNVASRYMQWVLIGGLLILAWTHNPLVLLVGIVLFSLTTVFSFVTLPVEFDASNRALAWLNTTGVVTSQQHAKAKNALWWAAMTYVVAALGSLATLMYYIMIFLRRR